MKTVLNYTGELKEAVELLSGGKCYLKNNKLHRTDGPAIEYSNGTNEWWYEGEKLTCSSQTEFERYLRLRAFW
jgi:hypothetical protein